MKKYIFTVLIVCSLSGISLALYTGLGSGPEDKEAVKLEDAIIIHGIEMDSETPVAENDGDGEGRIIFDDAFDDTIIDYDRVKQLKGKTVISKNQMKEFDRLREKDRRWHLCRYKIRRNDNLWNIARRFGVHQHLIISINSIDDPDMLQPGRLINVPSRRGIYYNVQKGDTVSRIAGRYRIAGKNIVAHNRLKGGVLRPGQKLFLPDVRESEARTEMARADKKKKGAAVIASARKLFIWPIRGRITSGFGTRVDPFTRDRRFHCGIDISANVGMPIRAAGNGRVIFNGWKPGYGKVVIVRHEGGYITVYAHNSRNVSPVDSEVSRGQVIAYSGMTGAVTGAHVHFEVRKYVNPLNPMRFLK